ncbi:hypothetical protein ACFYV5_32445 [Streptomyces sp. NPDC003035]|uniref:hypothetical protein n=1 Tax=Streptomyces sp. NPDC003035 TaxID=3364676 RepID=UPI0036A790D8
MRDHDIPESSESGLSTEDIVRAHDRGAAEEPGPETPPPMYPGESMGTASGAGPEDTTPTDEAPADEPQTEEPQTEESQAAEQDGSEADDSPALLNPEDEEAFRTRWHDIQSLFVDDPREAVHAADGLVADVMQKLAATFADHRQNLEGQWNKGESDTESLRLALRQYRSFFNRLLTT